MYKTGNKLYIEKKDQCGKCQYLKRGCAVISFLSSVYVPDIPFEDNVSIDNCIFFKTKCNLKIVR